MEYRILSLILAGFCLSLPSAGVKAQSGFAFQQYTYATTQSGLGSVRPMRVQADRFQNTYVLGYYEQTAIFSQTVGISGPGQQLYLAKFDPQGNAIWARTITGTRRWDRRGVEVAALFVDAEGHSYVSMLLDSSRFVAGTFITVPAGQRVATVSKYDALGTVYFSKYVATGADLSMPNYRPTCADLAGNIYFALNIRAGTQVRYGPKVGAFTGQQPMLVRLANTGNYAASITPEVKAQNRTYLGQFSAISCNERKVYIGGMVLDSLALRDETGARKLYPTNPGVAAEDWRFMFCMELDKATGKLQRYTEVSNINTVFGMFSGPTRVFDVTARPDSGCYYSYTRGSVSQGQSGSTVYEEYVEIRGAFGTSLLTSLRQQDGNTFDGLNDFHQDYYSFDKIHYSPDNTLLVHAAADRDFTPLTSDNVQTRPALASRVSLSNGAYLGSISIENRADICPLPGQHCFAAVGTVGGSAGTADDSVSLAPFSLLNSTLSHHGYLARYAGTPPSAAVITTFSPAAGRAGDRVLIKGKGFGRVFSLTFNGTKASCTRNTDSTLTAFVPAGAITGPITVYAASGSPISDSAFTILPTPVHQATRITWMDEVQVDFTLSPNPASDEVLVSGLDGDKPVVLSDLSGKEILRYTPSTNGSAKLKISSMQPGLYLVRQGSRTERLVKE